MFYELLAGMNGWDKQELYLQEAETYYYLNQVFHTEYFVFHEFSISFQSLCASLFSSVLLKGGTCELKEKQDKQDFQLLIQCFDIIGLHAEQVSTVWAILSSILQLGNICFSSYEVCIHGGERMRDRLEINVIHPILSFQSDSFEVAQLFSEAEARRVGSLLQISSEALQTVITHRVTVSSQTPT